MIASAPSSPVRSQKPRRHSRRRAAPPSTAASARGCARSRRAGSPWTQLGQVAAEVRVPGVAVDEVRALDAGGHRQVDRERLQRRRVRLAPRRARPRAGTRRPAARRPAGRAVGAPAVDGHLDEPRELAREVLDVDAGAAVDLGRVLAREERDPQVRHPPSRPCRSRRCRRRRRRSARGRPRVDADLALPARSATFLSTIALRTIALAADVDAVHAAPSPRPRRASGRCTPGESTERRTTPPETITPAQTIESTAMPGAARLLDARTSPAAARSCSFRIGQSRVVEVEDRVGRDQVHVGVVVGVERPDVAPVAALALGHAGHVAARRSRTPAPRPRATSIGMMSRADVVARVLVLRVRGDRVDQRLRVEDVVAHRGEHLVGRVGQPERVGRLLVERRDRLRRPRRPRSRRTGPPARSARGSRPTVTPAPDSRCCVDHLARIRCGRCGRRRRRRCSPAARRRSGSGSGRSRRPSRRTSAGRAASAPAPGVT